MMRMFLVFWATVWQQAWCLRTMNADHQPDAGAETGTDYNIVLSNSTPLSFLQKVFLQKSCKPEETKAGTCSETDDQKRNSTKKGNKSTPRKNKFLGSPAKSIESKEEFLDESDSENGGDSSEENDGANNVNGNKGNMEKAGMFLLLVLVVALVVYMLWPNFSKQSSQKSPGSPSDTSSSQSFDPLSTSATTGMESGLSGTITADPPELSKPENETLPLPSLTGISEKSLSFKTADSDGLHRPPPTGNSEKSFSF